jgi:hypothetical protein
VAARRQEYHATVVEAIGSENPGHVSHPFCRRAGRGSSTPVRGAEYEAPLRAEKRIA